MAAVSGEVTAYLRDAAVRARIHEYAGALGSRAPTAAFLAGLHPDGAPFLTWERAECAPPAAYDALTMQKPASAPSFPRPTTVELTFLTADMAEMGAWVRGVELSPDDARTVRFGGDDFLDLFRTFVTLVMLTRALVE